MFRLSDDLALVQTTDFFPPLVDDPFTFGRIAAANALSDVYAMGAEPLTALNLVGFPDKTLDHHILVDILRGGADACAEAGAVVVGGHSVRDSEIKFGLAVTGKVHPQRILTNAAAQPGDVLLLTKPLGTGVLCSAVKTGRLPETALSEAIASMSALNRPGRDAARDVGAHAATDVTGYGLVGHAFEMAQASRVTIEIESAAVPLMARVLEQAREGVLTRIQSDARAHLANDLQVENGVEDALLGVLLDAQTSGGLLLAVDAAQEAAAIASLHRHGAVCAVRVGRVTARAAAAVRVR